MRYAWPWTFLIVVVFAGCDHGPGTISIQGTVTFDGQPVQKGTIQFIPADETPGRATGGKITNGKYAIPKEGGPLAGGTYTVRIIGLRKTGKMAPKGPPVELEANYIPAAYNNQTILKVVTSESPLNFRLKKSTAAGMLD